MSKAYKHRDYISLLSKSRNAKRRRQLISLATPSELLGISEVIINLLRGHLKVTDAQHQQLTKYKPSLRKLAQKTTSKGPKKKILQGQQGGFLATLLHITLSALTSIVPALIKRRK